jgi:hydrogenase expression/formation protein HypC
VTFARNEFAFDRDAAEGIHFASAWGCQRGLQGDSHGQSLPGRKEGMCLGIPGKLLETYREHDVLMGKVDFCGVVKRVCLEHVPEARPGEYVLVHVGFALSRIDEAEARLVFEFLERMNQIDELKVPSS